MTEDRRKSSKQRWRTRAIAYSLIYLVIAGLWIMLSGKALDFLTNLADIRADLEVYKGLLFVLLTALALYALLHSWQNELPDPADASVSGDPAPRISLKLPILYLTGLGIVVASGGFVVYENLKNIELHKIEQNLTAVANLKTERISGWLKQNLNFAAAAGNGSYLASSFDLWMRNGKLPPDRAQWMRTRLDTLRQSYPYGELALLDQTGKTHLDTNREPPDAPEHVLPLVQHAIALKRPVIMNLHWHERVDKNRYVSMRIAAPLLPAGKDGEACGVILLEMNPKQHLLPLIESWPPPSQSAETLLIQHDGTNVVFLNDLRHRPNMALTGLRINDHPALLAAQAAKGRLGVMTGTDYRGVEVLGYAQIIPETGWIMIAKVDADEITQPIRRIAINVAAVALLLALIGSLSLFFWWRQRRAQYETARVSAELQRKMLEKQIEILSRHANDIILLMDDKGIIIDANDRAESVYGYPHHELVGMSVQNLRATGLGETPEAFIKKIGETAQKGMVFEAIHRRRDGSVFPVEISTRLIESANGNFVQSIIRDISERKQTDDALRLAATVFESSHSSIMIVDDQSRIIAVNPAYCLISGYDVDEVIGKHPRTFNSDRHGEDFFKDFWNAIALNGRWQGERWYRRKSGEDYPTWLSVTALMDEQGIPRQYIAIADDLSESKENQSQIDYLAYHDALTGLPNRLLAADRMDQAIAHAHHTHSRLAILLLDLDDFRTINDTLGHATGDLMLKSVAERLEHCVREADSVSRQGGDEFLIILADVTDLEMINGIAIDILDKVNRPYRVDGNDLLISTSIGIAVYPDDGMDANTLLKNADMAMYNAKQSGRNTHRFFAEEMNNFVLEHLLIRNGLVRALERQEFRLHYQPQLDLVTGKLIGAEALIRWQHPELGMVPPNRFIQVAEECGMIIPIGIWVMEEACRQAMAWQRAGFDGLVVGVNISAVQFRRGDMEQTVSGALEKSGLPAQYLELELTESILIQDVGKSLDTIRRLKDLGVSLSIDDFGTGYSSLSYLRQLPVDKLKIDQSFVREITARQDDAAIALSIITLAHTMNKKVIAEGVETQEQLRFMREHHCDEIQGYLLSRPLTSEDLFTFLERGVDLDTLTQT